MITIPTGELTGVLADCVPFVFPDEDIPDINCVRVAWDGHMLHALATDRYRIAWSQWHPDDDTPGEEIQDDLFTQWGGADDAWRTTVALADAKQLVSVFKLGPKEARCPLTVDYDAANDRLKVSRSRDTGHSAITVVAQGSGAEFPDLPAMLAKHDGATATRTVAYTAKFMADFAKVRPRAPMELTFTDALTHVAIGKRFSGAIMPVRLADDAN